MNIQDCITEVKESMKRKGSLIDLYYSVIPSIVQKKDSKDDLYPKTVWGLSFYLDQVRLSGSKSRKTRKGYK